MNKLRNLHYGWIIVFAGFLSQLSITTSRNLYTYLLPDMKAEFYALNEPMGNIASAYFVGYAIMTFVWGIFTDRIGPRKCMLMGQGIIVIGMAGMGTISSPYIGIFFYFLIGCGAAALFVPLASLMPRWFVPRLRGMALGFATAGMGVMTLVLGFTVPTVLAALSWRWGWWIASALILVLGIAIRSLLVDSPAQKGLGRVGSSREEILAAQQEITHNTQPLSRLSFKRILNQWSVWNLAGIYFMRGVSYTIFITFAVAYLKELGWDARAAAAVFALWGAFAIPSPIVWGIIADRLAKKYVITIALALEVVGIVVFLSGHTAGRYIGAAITGFADIGIPTLMASAMADYYQPRVIGTTFGLITLIFAVGCIIGPSLGGALADATGTLHTAMLLSLGTIALSLVLALVLKKPPRHGVLSE